MSKLPSAHLTKVIDEFIPVSSVITKDHQITNKIERFAFEIEDDVTMISPIFKSFKATAKIKIISKLKLNVILP